MSCGSWWPGRAGAGGSLFRTAEERISLRLLRVRPFDSGNLLLTYQPTGR